MYNFKPMFLHFYGFKRILAPKKKLQAIRINTEKGKTQQTIMKLRMEMGTMTKRQQCFLYLLILYNQYFL